MYQNTRTLLALSCIALGLSLTPNGFSMDDGVKVDAWVEGIVVAADGASGRLMVHGTKHQAGAELRAQDRSLWVSRKVWSRELSKSEKEIAAKESDFTFAMASQSKIADWSDDADSVNTVDQAAGILRLTGVKEGDHVVVRFSSDALSNFANEVIVLSTNSDGASSVVDARSK